MPRRTHRQWLLAVGLAVLSLAGGWLLLVDWSEAGRWALGSGALLAVLLARTRRLLPQNRVGEEGPILDGLGAGNWTTVVRALATGLLGGFLLTAGWPPGRRAWLPALLYLAVVLGDALDGHLARRQLRVTRFGERLDLELDGLSLLLVVLFLVRFDRLPSWYLLVGLLRYMFLFGLWWRRRRGGSVRELPPSPYRRLWAGFQMGFVAVALWPIVPAAGVRLAAWAFALLTVGGFVRDFLVVSQRLPAAAGADTFRRLERWLPLPLRGLLATGVAALWIGNGLCLDAWAEVLDAWGWWRPQLAASTLAAATLLATVAILCGAVGRTASLILLFAAVVVLQGSPPDGLRGIVLVAALGVLLLGTGAFSLWEPERAWLLRSG